LDLSSAGALDDVASLNRGAAALSLSFCLVYKRNRTAWLAVLILFAGRLLTSHPADDNDADLPKRYAELSRIIFPNGHGEQNFTWPSVEKEKQIGIQLRDLVRQQILSNLEDGSAASDAVKRSVETLQGDATLARWGKAAGNTPYVTSFHVRDTATLAVAYSVASGGQSVPEAYPFLDFYGQNQQGKWTLRAEAPMDAQYFGTSFFIAPLGGPRPNEQRWFLTWRRLFADTGASVMVRLFEYDGRRCYKVWGRDGMFAGQVLTTPSSFRLSFDKEFHSSVRVSETYEITSTGLKLTGRKLENKW
jgi:hypothetical protein